MNVLLKIIAGKIDLVNDARDNIELLEGIVHGQFLDVLSQEEVEGKIDADNTAGNTALIRAAGGEIRNGKLSARPRG